MVPVDANIQRALLLLQRDAPPNYVDAYYRYRSNTQQCRARGDEDLRLRGLDSLDSIGVKQSGGGGTCFRAGGQFLITKKEEEEERGKKTETTTANEKKTEQAPNRPPPRQRINLLI